MGAAHGEPCAAAAARRESLRVIQAACAEAPCAQRPGRTRSAKGLQDPQKITRFFVCLRFKRLGGILRRRSDKKQTGAVGLDIWAIPESHHFSCIIRRQNSHPFFLCCMYSVCGALHVVATQ